MSFSSIPEGERVQEVSPGMLSSSDTEQVKLNLSSAVLKTTNKSDQTMRSILKKNEKDNFNSYTSKKVRFSPEKQLKEVSKYLKPYDDEDRDIEDSYREEDNDDFDEITKENTKKNEIEGSKVQLHEDFFIEPYSKETRSFESAEKVYTKLSATNDNIPLHFKENMEMQENVTKRTQSGSESQIQNSLLGRVTTILNDLGERVRSILNRIVFVLERCLLCIRSNVFRENSNDSEPVLISIIYDSNISSSLGNISD